MRPHPRFRLPLAAALVLAGAQGALVCAGAPAVADSGPSAAFTITDPRIAESSGLAASHRHPGVYWTHNDSGDGPFVYAVDAATGRTLAKVTLRGVSARDCEAISIGPDGDIYLGDIGDNIGSWPQVWIYRFPEPRVLRDQGVDVTRYTVRYAGGPRNAESLMVDPRTGRVYIASKNTDGGGLYEGPARLSPSGVNVFRKIADVPWVTDGAFSPDGTRLLLRGYFGATDYRWHDGRPTRIGPVDMPLQPQGESVTYTPDGRSLMVGSEGASSEVWRVPLNGADLPDSDAPSPSPSPQGVTTGAAGDPRSAGGYPAGALALAVATALVMGVRRLLRRGK
jgi:hypothetical protein